MEEQQITQLAGMLYEALSSGHLDSAIQTLQCMNQCDVEIKISLTAPSYNYHQRDKEAILRHKAAFLTLKPMLRHIYRGTALSKSQVVGCLTMLTSNGTTNYRALC